MTGPARGQSDGPRARSGPVCGQPRPDAGWPTTGTGQLEPAVRTAVAAAAVGVTPNQLRRLARGGAVEPWFFTPGGHYRWLLSRLRTDLGGDEPPRS